MTPTISSQFDSGAIEVLDIAHANNTADIKLNIRKDSHADFRQWFHFRLSGARGIACTLRFENAGSCTYPQGWVDYRVVASYDRSHWFRVPTRYEGGVMTVEHTPQHDAIWYAYFEPYSLERHQTLIGRASDSPLARVERLGASVEGRDIDLITIGKDTGASKKTIWIIARQHPGESMAEWFVEGMIERLPKPWREIDILVNNAGHDTGGRRRFDEGSAEEWASIIETNVIGLIRVTRAVIPGMIARDRGHVVNIGSISGYKPYATGTIYAASKFAVHGFSESLRLDYRNTGVRVTEILPGMVRTGFAMSRWGDGKRAKKFYEDFGTCLNPEDVAGTIAFAVQQPPHVVISQLVVVPNSQT